MGHGPGGVGEVAGQRFELPFDLPRRHARRQQLCQPTRRGHFLEIKIRQPPHLADRHDQSPPVPAANHRHRDAQQIGQHGRRIEPVDLLLGLDQPEPLPKLGLGDDLDRALLDLPSRGLVEPLVLILYLGEWELLLADDNQVGRNIRFLQHRRAMLAGQLGRIALGHAGQPADERDPLILQYHGGLREVVNLGRARETHRPQSLAVRFTHPAKIPVWPTASVLSMRDNSRELTAPGVRVSQRLRSGSC